MAKRKASKNPAISTSRPVGRPTDYTPEIGAEICCRLAAGETLIDICESDERFPARTTVFEWTRKHPEFRDAYKIAREDQQHSFADKILQRSLDESRDVIYDEILDQDGNVAARKAKSDNTAVQRDKLICENMKFLMARLNSMYADKQKLEHSGPEGGPFPVMNIGVKTEK